MVFDAIKPTVIWRRIAEARAAKRQPKSETSSAPTRRVGGWPTTPGYDNPSNRWPY